MANIDNNITNIITEENSLFWTVGRLKTYENWPFKGSKNQCIAKTMAAAGFYSIGDEQEPDLVECFICKKQLNGWEGGDDPWEEHRKHQPTCEFIALNKHEESLWTLNEMFTLLKLFVSRTCDQYLALQKQKYEQEVEAMVESIPNLFIKSSRKNKC